MRRADGEWRWNVVKGRPVMNAEGEVESWVCTITEVEELVKVSLYSLSLEGSTDERCLGEERCVEGEGTHQSGPRRRRYVPPLSLPSVPR